MITAKVGQRIVRRRRGCKPQRGTVAVVEHYDDYERAYWLRIDWDYGVSCHVWSNETSLRDLKRG